RAVIVEFEPVAHILAQHRRRKRAKALAVFDAQIQGALHFRISRIAEDRAVAEGARAELHPSLEAADGLALDEGSGGGVEQRRVIEHVENGARRRETLLDLGLGELRPEIASLYRVEPIG